MSRRTRRTGPNRKRVRHTVYQPFDQVVKDLREWTAVIPATDCEEELPMHDGALGPATRHSNLTPCQTRDMHELVFGERDALFPVSTI